MKRIYNEKRMSEKELMRKKRVIKEIPMFILLLIPFAVIAFLWNDLPEQVPIHWSMGNEADIYADKLPGLFLIPILNFGIYFLFLGVPRIDPRWKDFHLFDKTFYWLRFGIVLFMVIVWSMSILSIYGIDLNIGMLIVLTITTIFFGIGITMPKIKQNPYLGIRLPWTLKDEENWEKSHKFGGKVWIIGSLIIYAISFFIEMPLLLYIFIFLVIMIIIIPMIYSYRLYKNKQQRNNIG